MKKALLACAMFVGALSANAQKQNVFKVNLFSPIVKSGSFFYERAINAKSSVQMGVGFTSYKKDDIKLSGIFLTPEYRFYLSSTNEAPSGFYVGPYLRYQNLKIEDKEAGGGKATLTTFGGGLSVGRQWIFSDVISLDIFAGPNYNSGKVKVTSGNVDEDELPLIKGFGARVGVTLGVAF